MTELAAEELLHLWEQARGARDTLDRAVALAATATAHDAREVEGWPVVTRDLAIVALRQRNFGPWVAALGRCTGCATEVEVDFDLRAVETTAPPQPRPARLVDGREISLRWPTTRDVRAAAAQLEAGPRALLARCVVTDDVTEVEVTDELLEVGGRALAELDPTDIELALSCPDCAQQWTERLDVADLFWRELDARAQRLLDEVHLLGRAYGWSERDILALTMTRRQAYLERAGGS